MEIKNYLLPIILVLFISCNQPSTKGEVNDSNQMPSYTVASKVETAQVNEPIEADEPAIDSLALVAPEFSFYAQTLSVDNREAKIVHKLAQQIELFNEERYAIIKMSYTHADAVMMGNVVENETWYYNANRQLCAFSSTYKSERTSMTSLYLCKDGALLDVISDSEFQDEGPRAYTSVRIVSSLCPLCGLNLSKEEENDNPDYQISVLDESEVDKYSRDFFTKHEDMLKGFGGIINVIKDGERYSAFVFVNSDTIKYSVDPNLVNKFFKKGSFQK